MAYKLSWHSHEICSTVYLILKLTLKITSILNEGFLSSQSFPWYFRLNILASTRDLLRWGLSSTGEAEQISSAVNKGKN